MAFTVTISGTDRTASVVFNSLRKQDHINQQIDTLEFVVRKYGALTSTGPMGPCIWFRPAGGNPAK